MTKTSIRRIALIMAGGSGERFWPLSRKSTPKQLLPILPDGSTLIGRTLSTLLPLFPKGDICLAAGNAVAGALRETDTGIPPDNIFVEPAKRNTTGCLVWSAANLLSRTEGDASAIVMGVFPADHVITKPEAFGRIVRTALDSAGKENALVTLGITPSRPETGYGYIEMENTALPGSEERYRIPVHRVLRFCEKPGRETAGKYISSGSFLWNSGMFFWRLSTLLEELAAVAPPMAQAVTDIAGFLARGERERAEEIFSSLDSVSIDYALMEKSRRVLVVRADIGWDDIGAWDALDRLHQGDGNGNILSGEPAAIDCRNCIVCNEPGAENMAVGVIGAENLAVIVTADGILVCPKNRAQDVRKVVEELKRRNAPQL